MLPKLPRLTPQEAENILLKAGFEMVRSKGSDRIYMKRSCRKGTRKRMKMSLRSKIRNPLQLVQSCRLNQEFAVQSRTIEPTWRIWNLVFVSDLGFRI